MKKITGDINAENDRFLPISYFSDIVTEAFRNFRRLYHSVWMVQDNDEKKSQTEQPKKGGWRNEISIGKLIQPTPAVGMTQKPRGLARPRKVTKDA